MAQDKFISAAKALYPKHPSIEDTVRTVRGETGMNPAQRIWRVLVSTNEASKRPGEPQRPYWVPRSAPRAFKKKGK